MWHDAPPDGTPICLGFDGSDFDDWTAIRAETIGGWQFTPRYGASGLPTVWKPKEWPDHRTPRAEVREAFRGCFDTFDVRAVYADPWRFETDLDDLADEYGEDRVVVWFTDRPKQMHEALERFVSDLAEGRIPHDGCPLTDAAMRAARKFSRNSRYVLGKPNDHQKIDPTMASVLAHEAAAVARANGWTAEPEPTYFRLPR